MIYWPWWPMQANRSLGPRSGHSAGVPPAGRDRLSQMWPPYPASFADGVSMKRIQLRSEEHTSELQSLMRISYAVFCLKKKSKINEQRVSYKTPLHTLHYTNIIEYSPLPHDISNLPRIQK